MSESAQNDVPEWARDRLVMFPAAVARTTCETITALGCERPLAPGPLYDEVKAERVFDPTVRQTSVGWFTEKDWVFDLMREFAMRVNATWGFDITENDPMQFAVYRRGDFFEWHKDMLRVRQTMIRKISVVLQLDAPGAYVGGKLEFLDNDHGVFVPQSFAQQGSVAVFSPLLKHRVTPLKSGERRSLTAWFKGPPFR